MRLLPHRVGLRPQDSRLPRAAYVRLALHCPACCWRSALPLRFSTSVAGPQNMDPCECFRQRHEIKAKGKSVHSAMATGCTSCHEIRVNKDVTRSS